MLLKRAVTKFRGQINDGASSANDTVRSGSPTSAGAFREKLINRLSAARNASQQQLALTGPSNGEATIAEANETSEAPTTPATTTTTTRRSFKDKSAGGSGTGTKWKFVRQKSQQMLHALTSPDEKQKSLEDAGITMTASKPPRPKPALPVKPASSASSTTSSVVASSMMHDFNLAMSEYRTEIKDNIAQLDAKINRLESVILALGDKFSSTSASSSSSSTTIVAKAVVESGQTEKKTTE